MKRRKCIKYSTAVGTNNGAPKSNSCKTRVWTIRWPPVASSTSSTAISTTSQSSLTGASLSLSSGRPRGCGRSKKQQKQQNKPLTAIHRTNTGAPKLTIRNKLVSSMARLRNHRQASSPNPTSRWNRRTEDSNYSL